MNFAYLFFLIPLTLASPHSTQDNSATSATPKPRLVILRASDEDARRTSTTAQPQKSATSTYQTSSPSQTSPAPQAIANGKSNFRVFCSYCHGINANGGFRAPSLISGHLSHGDSDDATLNTILHGIPGTAMPANDIDEPTAREIIAYLHTLQKSSSASINGNPESGRKLFFGEAYCSRCHMVAGQGGRLGPELSRVGAMRPHEFLVESIRNPDAEFTERAVPLDFGTVATTYELVTVTTRQGTALSGVILNEDTFSLQFMDDHEKIHSWLKSELKSVVHEKRSPMPKYDNHQLSDSQLDDLTAYLSSLRGESK